jgi:hypothetical protein
MTCRRCGKAPAAENSGWCDGCLRAEDERREQLNGTVAARARAQQRADLELPGGRRRCAWEYCGQAFTPKRSTGRYCSGACRVAAHRARQNGLSVTGG